MVAAFRGGEAQNAAVALRPGGVAIVAGAEPDDRAPGLRFVSGDVPQESGQRLRVTATHGRGGTGDQPGDVVPGRLHYVAAFAAAFIAFLYSRTFVSDSGDTMSATLRYEPSSP